MGRRFWIPEDGNGSQCLQEAGCEGRATMKMTQALLRTVWRKIVEDVSSNTGRCFEQHRRCFGNTTYGRFGLKRNIRDFRLLGIVTFDNYRNSFLKSMTKYT